MLDPERTPVLIAGAHSIVREGVVRPLDVAADAARAALDDAGKVADRVSHVSVVNVLGRVGAAPATKLAGMLGLLPKTCETTTVGGNTPQMLVNRLAGAIAKGELEAALIAGAEAMRSSRERRRIREAGGEVPGGVAAGAGAGAAGGVEAEEEPPPDPVVGSDEPGISAGEATAGLLAPVHIYPLFETALAAAAGRSLAEQRMVDAQLFAPFTEVAARHPYAWFRDAASADELATASPANRMVCEPYTKRLCSFIGGDQGAAVVLCSLAAARAAGLEDRAVFIWSGADATDAWYFSSRPVINRSPGIAAASGAALAAAGVDVDGIGAFDLYSCFPSAVQFACAELGLAHGDPRGLTVTGGLPYFGGPGNNYVTHAIATMAESLRERGGLGLVSGLGWYLTKHSYGVYGATPPPEGFRLGDTSAEQAKIDANARTVLDATPGGEAQATVLGTCVAYDDTGTVTMAPVLAEVADPFTGATANILAKADPAILTQLAGTSVVGQTVRLTGAPPVWTPLD